MSFCYREQKKLHRISVLLVSMLINAAVLSVWYLSYSITWSEFGFFGQVAVPEPGNTTRSIIDFSGWSLFFAIAATFPNWLHTLTKILAVSHGEFAFTSRAAALCFFVPGNLWRPYIIMRSMCLTRQQLNDEEIGLSERLLKLWSLSWAMLLVGATLMAAVEFRIFTHGFVLIKHHDIAELWMYGSAAMFCALSIPIVIQLSSPFSFARDRETIAHFSKSA